MSNDFLGKLKTREPTGAAAKVAVGRKRRSLDTEADTPKSDVSADSLENLNKNNPPVVPSAVAPLETKHGADAPVPPPSQLKITDPGPAIGLSELEIEGRTDPKTQLETEGRTDPKTQLETEGRTDPKTQLETEGRTQARTDPETQLETEGRTQARTDPETQLETEGRTQARTDPETQPETEGRTQARTDPETQPETEGRTQARTDPETQPETEGRTQARTDPETQPETEGRTQARTDPETQPETEGRTQAKTDPETEGRTQAKTDPETEGETRRVKKKNKSNGYKNIKPEEFSLEMGSQGSPKMRVLEFLARSALAGDPYGLTERLNHDKICERLIITNVNLKKILVRLVDDSLISCDKQTSKLGRSGWVRYRVHEYALQYFTTKGHKADVRQRSNHKLSANNSRAGASAISKTDISDQPNDQTTATEGETL